MNEPACPAKISGLAYLEHYPVQSSQPVQRIVLDTFPFIIGRGIASNFVLSSPQVSKKHLAIERTEQGYSVSDLGSTNGTFVNGKSVTKALLVHDDVLHVGNQEFRFVCQPILAPPDSVLLRTVPSPNAALSSIIRSNQYLMELLEQHAVRVIFQPIVCLQTREPLGYEALARGTHADLSIKPSELLSLAEQCGMASALSQVFRLAAVVDAAQLPEGKALFVNLHPAELTDSTLLDALVELQTQLDPPRQVVIEIPETAVAELTVIRTLRDRLKKAGLQVAYDDFGAGQSRVLELAEVPPDFIKLDMRLIRNLHLSDSRQNLIGALNRVGTELNVQIIAEGIETREEAEICLDLGCHFGQGYWFGRPTGVGLLHRSSDATVAAILLS